MHANNKALGQRKKQTKLNKNREMSCLVLRTVTEQHPILNTDHENESTDELSDEVPHVRPVSEGQHGDR